jgi:ribosomal protein L37AE/L43A
MKPKRTRKELMRYDNHPLRGARQVCPQCKGVNVMAPSYPGDYFDCQDCGQTMAPTAKQVEAMRNRKPITP